ncbi:MAG: hypothetical protein PHG02_07280 [Oscillospiraceae bacterium]|nr:hypothetical protein [Oscillospiraceae bacterium]
MKRKKLLITLLCIGLALVSLLYIAQTWGAHWGRDFERGTAKNLQTVLKKEILDKEDYAFIFSQTGVGSSAVKTLRAQGESGKQEILEYQKMFFAQYHRQCTSLYGWFVKEDILVDENNQRVEGPPIVSLQEGDILIALATHSLGWTHGHAAIAVDEDTVLQSRVIGENSNYSQADEWRKYENYVVVRVKNTTLQQKRAVTEFSKAVLYDVPYKMTAGLFGLKSRPADSDTFGTQCAYLAWYAWNYFGIDLDSDAGRLVTPYDILSSNKIEIVQMYGLNPALFADRI